ncbi:MAG: M48 family metallopeptidase [Gammaproteobacteria bacterium]
MIEIQATYYDGKTPVGRPVTVLFYESGKVRIYGSGISIDARMSDISISPRIADARRNIYLSNGGKLETAENEAVDIVLGYFNTGSIQRLLHWVENQWSHALFAVLSSALCIWAFIEFGVPAAALWTAKSFPPSTESEIGIQGFNALDEMYLSPTSLETDDIERIRSRFDAMAASMPQKYPYRLEFRNSPLLGANALALPGGLIVVTDGLVKLAENDDQIVAILAHEIGHVEHQHGLRAVLQDSITTLFIAVIVGDVASITTLSSALPAILVQNRYSRKFELDADIFAADLLADQNIPLQAFCSMLARLSNKQGESERKFGYLSTHPDIPHRIERIREHKTLVR